MPFVIEAAAQYGRTKSFGKPHFRSTSGKFKSMDWFDIPTEYKLS